MIRLHPYSAIIALAFLALVMIYSSSYVVNQTETALVTQFGNPVTVEQEPGLKFKIPFIQTVEYFDNRLLEYSMPEEIEINASDEKRIKLEAFLRWRIVDPLAFYRATRTAGIGGNRVSAMNLQLANMLGSSLRQAIGNVPLKALLSPERERVMQKIRDLVSKQTASSKSDQGDKDKNGFGIEIVDVRIVKADLPSENSDAVFLRMKAERKREATTYRAVGDQDSQRIKANAELEKTVILAEAQKKSETLRGEGDADASKIFAEAFGRDPEFFDFYRSMQAYVRSLNPKDTNIILSPDSQFLRQFNKPEKR